MFRIKRLYAFILQGFLPLFVMTFCICLFIVLMQFLWRYIDELVGKGLEFTVIAELFFYAALTMVPMALPLAILLASLMLFGNLGERFELTAMKASGISLIRTMRPLIVFLVLISIGAFFFQNDVLPKAQVKMWTLLYSMRQKSPELDIPEGAFYSQIPGYNLFVDRKDINTGKLYDLVIYDVSKGFGESRIILADSGKMSFTEDKKHLYLELWRGAQFENLREQQVANQGVPYRRESFSTKNVMIPFDASFTRMDDSTMSKQYIGKNIAQLRHTIDSVNVRLDSIGNVFGKELQSEAYVGVSKVRQHYSNTGKITTEVVRDVEMKKPLNVDSILNGGSIADRQRHVALAIDRIWQAKNSYEFKSYSFVEDQKVIRRHQIEMHKKFTLSVACLLFFFIGAPLGAIIRKGGLGMPIVISVLLFIFYYIIDTAGYKMARDGRVEVWGGMWASTAVLLPLGILLTYKSVNDSSVFKSEVYTDFFRRLLGWGTLRRVEMKESSMDDVVSEEAIGRLEHLISSADSFVQDYGKRQSYLKYWLKGIDRGRLKALSAELEDVVAYLANSREQIVINKLADYPVLRSLLLYRPVENKMLAYTFIILFPIGLAGYLIGGRQQAHLLKEVRTIVHVSKELIKLHSEKTTNKLYGSD